MDKRRAWRDLRRFYRMEMQSADPTVADMMVTYYPRGAGEGVPKAGALRFAIELRGQQIGYGDAFRRRAKWNLRIHLSPVLWGPDSERHAIQLLTAAAAKSSKPDDAPTFALNVPSAAHFEALCAGECELARALGLTV